MPKQIPIKYDDLLNYHNWETLESAIMTLSLYTQIAEYDNLQSV